MEKWQLKIGYFKQNGIPVHNKRYLMMMMIIITMSLLVASSKSPAPNHFQLSWFLYTSHLDAGLVGLRSGGDTSSNISDRCRVASSCVASSTSASDCSESGWIGTKTIRL
jgi:hypothetical protein